MKIQLQSFPFVSLLTIFVTMLDFVITNPVQFQLQPQSQYQFPFQNNNMNTRQFLQQVPFGGGDFAMTTEVPKEQESSFFSTALSYASFVPYWPFVMAYNWATNTKTQEQEMEEYMANIPGLHRCSTLGLSCERSFECCSGQCSANWMGNKKCYQPPPSQL